GARASRDAHRPCTRSCVGPHCPCERFERRDVLARGATHLLYGTSMTTILIDKNIMLPMRDGVRLATDVYRLDSAPPAPVLLTRTPYNKEHTVVSGGGVAFDVLRAVHAGYALVIQAVRRRFA